MDLITGSTGFIGRHLTQRLLAQGRPVRVLCRDSSVARLAPGIRQRAEIARGDLRDPASLSRATRGIDRVFHCAGQVSDWGRLEEFHSVNVEGTRSLLQAASANQVRRFVHLSSIAVFGVPSPPYFDDETPYGPGTDPYSRTKIEGEKLVLKHHAETGFPVTVLRPSVVYGPYSTWVEEPLSMIRKNRMFLIERGRGTCHPCYIENLLDAILLAAESERAVGKAYIIGDDEPLRFSQYFNHLARIAGYPAIRRSIPLHFARALATGFETFSCLSGRRSRPLLTHAAIDMVCTRSRMSMKKIRWELGYRPRFGVEAAMRELRRFYQEGFSTEVLEKVG